MKLTDRFNNALLYAIVLHEEQVRKGTETPYCSHLLAVTSLVLEHEGTETQAIAALLHDCLEDTAATYNALAERFGVEVADIVQGCTDDLPGIDRSRIDSWRLRKEAYLAHLGTASESVLESRPEGDLRQP